MNMNLAESVVDWMIAGGWIDVNDAEREALIDNLEVHLTPIVPEVEVHRKFGGPTTCKVWYDEVLEFSGADFSSMFGGPMGSTGQIQQMTDPYGNDFGSGK